MTHTQQVSIGDKVRYHGSQEKAHGEYYVAYIPDDVNGRGYVLVDKPLAASNDAGDGMLYGVHRESFTLVEANLNPR